MVFYIIYIYIVRKDGSASMNERMFRDAMGKFATGISIVSIYDNNVPKGMTVNAFMSISLDPMLIAISIDENATMYNDLQKAEKLGISFLKDSQKDISRYFARQLELEYEIAFIDQDGAPVLKDSLASISCLIKNKIKAGDHLIFIAEVTDIIINDGEPLVYFGGTYRYLSELNS